MQGERRRTKTGLSLPEAGDSINLLRRSCGGGIMEEILKQGEANPL